jgi:hypothetical protein
MLEDDADAVLNSPTELLLLLLLLLLCCLLWLTRVSSPKPIGRVSVLSAVSLLRLSRACLGKMILPSST